MAFDDLNFMTLWLVRYYNLSIFSFYIFLQTIDLLANAQYYDRT